VARLPVECEVRRALRSCSAIDCAPVQRRLDRRAKHFTDFRSYYFAGEGAVILLPLPAELPALDFGSGASGGITGSRRDVGSTGLAPALGEGLVAEEPDPYEDPDELDLPEPVVLHAASTKTHAIGMIHLVINAPKENDRTASRCRRSVASWCSI
jgi:hypothetical protein